MLGTARAVGALPGFSLLMVDTENKFVSTGAFTHIYIVYDIYSISIWYI